MIVVFAIVAAALAGVPGERVERQVYSTYGGVIGGAPLAYSAYSSPYYGSSPYAYSAYGGYPTAYSASVYSAPAVRYY